MRGVHTERKYCKRADPEAHAGNNKEVSQD